MTTNKILLSVNKVYAEQSPSKYFNVPNKKNINQIFDNKKKFLIQKLKLPSRMFKNSELLDLGCGSGQNTITYDWLGAKCTLVEYDKSSASVAKNLFTKYAKNNFKVINKDLFKYKSIKKFDYVISNGVAHHTSDTTKCIKIAIKFLKKNGILILGLGETNGFFQRNLQRYILYNLSKDKIELIKLAKLFFSDNLNRAKKYGGRTILQIIYDTYLNPRIDTLSFHEIDKLFKDNKLHMYSSDEVDFSEIAGRIKQNQFILKKKIEYKKNLVEQKFILNTLINFSNLNVSSKLENTNIKILGKLSNIQSKLSDKIKNYPQKKFKIFKIDKLLRTYEKNVSKLKKIDTIDKKHIFTFFNELNSVLNILNSKSNKVNKIKKLKILIKKNKLLFKGSCGKGMNYFVGTKV